MRRENYPGELSESIDPKKGGTEPYYEASEHVAGHLEEAQWSLSASEEVDANDNIFANVAHNESLPKLIEFFSKKADKMVREG